MSSSKLFSAFALGGLALASASLAHADDSSTQYTQAVTAYNNRTSPDSVTQGLQLLTQAETTVADDDAKYDILILESRLYYWQGDHLTDNDAKLASFTSGMDAATRAKAVDGDYSDAFYCYAANLGDWALAKGVLASLSRKQELLDNLNAALNAVSTHSGSAAETYDAYGPDRALGRTYFKLPTLAGGSLSESIKHLSKAYSAAPTDSKNILYYAESLSYGTNDQKTLAKQLLTALAAVTDPAAFDPTRAPETTEDIEAAKALLNTLN